MVLFNFMRDGNVHSRSQGPLLLVSPGNRGTGNEVAAMGRQPSPSCTSADSQIGGNFPFKPSIFFLVNCMT